MKGDTHYVMFGYAHQMGFDQEIVVRVCDYGFLNGPEEGLILGYAFGKLDMMADKFEKIHEEIHVPSYDSISGIHNIIEVLRIMEERGYERPPENVQTKLAADHNGNINDRKVCNIFSAIVMQAHDEEMETKRVYRIPIAQKK